MEKILLKNNKKRRLNSRNIGNKGLGLYRLAKLSRKYGYKVPDFLIIPVDYYGRESNITLRAKYLKGEGNYAVRSSSPYEDSNNHSFAGIFETLLNVQRSDLVDAVHSVKASATSERAQNYVKERGITIDDKMAVIVQRMVDSDIGGVIYSTLPDYPIAASIEFCSGSPKGVVDGTAKTQINDFDKKTLNEIFEDEEYHSNFDNKHYSKFTWDFGNQKGIKTSLKISQALEKEFGFPLNIEFAWLYRGRNMGNLNLLQAREITDIQHYPEIKFPKIPQKDVILRSDVVRGIGEYTGPAAIHTYVINRFNEPFEMLKRDLRDIDETFSNGYVLFVPNLFSYADYDGCTPNKKAIVEFSNSIRSSHAMTIAREKGILYMGKGHLGFNSKNYEKNVTSKIKNGDIVKVVLNGRKGIVYKAKECTNPLSKNFY